MTDFSFCLKLQCGSAQHLLIPSLFIMFNTLFIVNVCIHLYLLKQCIKMLYILVTEFIGTSIFCLWGGYFPYFTRVLALAGGSNAWLVCHTDWQCWRVITPTESLWDQLKPFLGLHHSSGLLPSLPYQCYSQEHVCRQVSVSESVSSTIYPYEGGGNWISDRLSDMPKFSEFLVTEMRTQVRLI